MRRHLAPLVLVLTVVFSAYAGVLGAYYCGYDDFHERHRAAFVDARDPSRILTTFHNDPFMYRPLTSAIQYGTWRISDTPQAYRIRDLSMHLVSVAMIYGIASLLAGSTLVAVGSALLFGLHPLANQPVVVAVWTNTTADAFLFASFLLFLFALRAVDAGRRWGAPLAFSCLLALVAIFTYEGTIVVFGWMCGYLALRRWRGQRTPAAFLRVFASASALILAAFFVVRHLVLTEAVPIAPPATIVRDFVAYIAALLMPVDAILANGLFGTPLPSRSLEPGTLLVPALSGALFIGGIGALVVRYRRNLDRVDRPLLVLLLLAIPFSVAPLVLHRDHPTETDLYVPAALFAIVVSLLLWQLTRTRTVFGAAVGVLCVVFAAGITVRNHHVVACGSIVRHILAQLPTSQWQTGAWQIRLATPPGERLAPRYGIYGLSGIETIEVKGTGTPGAQEALQLATANTRVRVGVVTAVQMDDACTRPDTCFWISPNGAVSEVRAKRISQTREGTASQTRPLHGDSAAQER